LELKNAPQILEHKCLNLNLTPYDAKWIPSSARFVMLGSHPKMTGALHVYKVNGPDLELEAQATKPSAFKCGTFGASGLLERRLATGDFGGKLCIWDLERLAEPVFQSQAHASIINQVDGCGGQAKGIGPPELATCGRDGCVRVWDVRQADAPVAAFEPTQGQQVRDAWCVALGDSYNDTERSLLAGYDNGDVKLFDLKMNKLRWETNVKNGVCGVEFDRRDIPMNKFMVCCLEAKLHCFDARTLHPSKGFASTTAQIDKGPTVWGSRTLPQNREVVGVQGGDGTLYVYRYRYPDQRKVKDPDGVDMGVAGTLELVNSKNLSTQPLGSLDWSPDKEGLCVTTSFDQCVRVAIVTKTKTLA